MSLEDDIIAMVIEESMKNDIPLGFCDADGKGVLCDNYASILLPCGHAVCTFHEDFCIACFSDADNATRKIQRYFRRYLFTKRLQEHIDKKHRAATKVISFFKMVQAMNKLKKYKRERWKAKFLSRFS